MTKFNLNNEMTTKWQAGLLVVVFFKENPYDYRQRVSLKASKVSLFQSLMNRRDSFQERTQRKVGGEAPFLLGQDCRSKIYPLLIRLPYHHLLILLWNAILQFKSPLQRYLSNLHSLSKCSFYCVILRNGVL